MSTFVSNFAKHRKALKRVVDKSDIVENHRDWKAYCLNPLVTKLCA